MLVNWSRWLKINLTERFHLDLKLLYIWKLKKLLLCFELYLHWNLLGKIHPFVMVLLAQRIRKTNENPEILTMYKFLINFFNSLHYFSVNFPWLIFGNCLIFSFVMLKMIKHTLKFFEVCLWSFYILHERLDSFCVKAPIYLNSFQPSPANAKYHWKAMNKWGQLARIVLNKETMGYFFGVLSNLASKIFLILSIFFWSCQSPHCCIYFIQSSKFDLCICRKCHWGERKTFEFSVCKLLCRAIKFFKT